MNGEIAAAVKGRDASDQRGLDEAMIALDGTDGKSRLGANAILGVSMASARAAAADAGQPLWRYLGGADASLLPVPTMNVLNGGVHADNPVDFQEFMVAPVGASSFAQALQIGAEVYQELKRTLHSRGLSTAIGDEGGFAPNARVQRGAARAARHGDRQGRLQAGRGCRDLLRSGRERVLQGWQLRAGRRGADAVLGRDGGCTGRRSSAAIRCVSLEDGMAEQDWDGWRLLTERLGETRSARRRRHLRDQPGDPARGHRARASATRS